MPKFIEALKPNKINIISLIILIILFLFISRWFFLNVGGDIISYGLPFNIISEYILPPPPGYIDKFDYTLHIPGLIFDVIFFYLIGSIISYFISLKLLSKD